MRISLPNLAQARQLWRANANVLRGMLESARNADDVSKACGEHSVQSVFTSAQLTLIGTLTHRLLERIARDGLSLWSLDRVQRQASWIEYQCEQAAVAVSSQLTHTVISAVCNTLTDERGRWLLAQGCDSQQEWMLMDGDADTAQIQGHVIDRSFVDEAGVRWIVDYKTSQWPENTHVASQAALISARLAEYTPQLQRYVALLQQLEPHRCVRAALYFPLWPQAVRWQLLVS
jgi:ATP-dependent exoDNAse (exonuclease V) beta subunit